MPQEHLQARRDQILQRVLAHVEGAGALLVLKAPPGSGKTYVTLRAMALARHRGRRVAVASYLLAEGLFQQRLRECGADVVAEPLGIHPAVVRLIARRRGEAVLVAA